MTDTNTFNSTVDNDDEFEFETITPPSQWPQFLRNVAAVALGVWLGVGMILGSVWVARNLQVPEEFRSEQREVAP